ncbi:serine hydrolase FSH [Poronia punctata]|nr:serine hydrolase FSH [Poronia punctata]
MRILILEDVANQRLEPLVDQLWSAIVGASDRTPSAKPASSSAGLVAGEEGKCNYLTVPEELQPKEALRWLHSTLKDDGLYDGVLASSNAASLVASYLLLRNWCGLDGFTPFRFAVFFSGSLSLTLLKSLGVFVSPAALDLAAEVENRRNQGLGPLAAHVSKRRRAMYDSDDCFGLDLNRIPLFLKFRIPTVHVWGWNDPAFPLSIHLAGLCDAYLKKTHEFDRWDDIIQELKTKQGLYELLGSCAHRRKWPGQDKEEPEAAPDVNAEMLETFETFLGELKSL